MPDLRCSYCNKPVQTYFQIARVVGGTAKLQANVCSIACLAQWAYTYATFRGMQGVVAVKTAVTGLLDSLRGSR